MSQIEARQAVKPDETPSPLRDYDPAPFYCELLRNGAVTGKALERIRDRLSTLDIETLVRRAADAEHELFNLGITFTVYSDKDAIDRILPFDVLPRVITAAEWRTLEAGVIQRVRALNLFLWDVYHDQKIFKDGVVPKPLVFGNANYRKEMQGLNPYCGTYMHISGIDLVRGRDGEFCVLEDNGRSPSGVSYVVENRHLMQRAFPDLMRGLRIRPVSNYGEMLIGKLLETAPPEIEHPCTVLLSPGVYNSAYFEHIFLAREMGIPLVEGRDLVIEDDRVFMRTLAGLEPVHVVYRRINDDFLDPEVFNKDSMLGVAGLMRAAAKGNVTLANAVGTGVADDKAVYAYVPAIIKYYLGEDAILRNVETHICGTDEGLAYTLDRLSELVVKPVGESGGYGIVIGPKATKAELEKCREQIKANPDNFISQPLVGLSVCPTLVDGKVEPRHVDLRPYAVTGRDTWVLPGGLTRVALKRNSLIVNSSQGGGTKDTWVLEEETP